MSKFIMSNLIWKVFAPYELFSQSSAHLYGHVNADIQSVYITASCDTNDNVTKHSDFIQDIGEWICKDEPVHTVKMSKQKGNHWVTLHIDLKGNVCCKIIVYGQSRHTTCIIYDPAEFMKSSLLRQKTAESGKPNDNVGALVKVLQDSNLYLGQYEKSAMLKVYSCVPRNSNFGSRLCSIFLFLVNIMYMPLYCLGLGNAGSKPGRSLKQKAVGVSSTLSQLQARALVLVHLKEQRNIESLQQLESVNAVVTQILDSVLGVTLMYLLMSNNTAQFVANMCLAYGDNVAGELKLLLEWLMGAPAGLKLNSQLTHILGRFFQYHIYLWTGYLYILKPVLGQLVYYSSVAGIWGLSVQLALFQDIFSTMTIHIYCFYVYAARLYRLQMYALASLWRLFRGKKWNVLRERVDSAVYDVDQLFVGTLLFTVLLFILPTTGLYYVVFTMLRVMVLTVQGLLTRARHLLTTLPCWYLLLWIYNSPAIRDGAVFQVIPSEKTSSDAPLVLSLQTSKPSLTEVLLLGKRPVSSSSTIYPWSTIVKNLFLGHLIYPWIEKKQ